MGIQCSGNAGRIDDDSSDDDEDGDAGRDAGCTIFEICLLQFYTVNDKMHCSGALCVSNGKDPLNVDIFHFTCVSAAPDMTPQISEKKCDPHTSMYGMKLYYNAYDRS